MENSRKAIFSENGNTSSQTSQAYIGHMSATEFATIRHIVNIRAEVSLNFLRQPTQSPENI